MTVSYLAPLQRAVARARSLLFSPFRLEMWLVLGFAAFLSEWLSGGAVQGGGQRFGTHGHGFHPFGLLPALVWGPLLVALVSGIIVVAIVFLWLGSRGKFVFLDDVVHGRAAIVEPWNRFARLGNSLFLWKLGFGVLGGALMIGVVGATMGTAVLSWLRFHERLAMAPPIIGGIALVSCLGLLFVFIGLLLDNFVVPLMYRQGLNANAAWGRFLPLFREHLGQFILYALFLLVVWIVVFAAVVAVGFATCCIGFLLMLGPYIGQVVLLPVYVGFRYLGPEFLAQFGPEFDVFAQPQAQPPAAPAPAPGPARGATA
jgi:hypothetical protein